MFDSEGHTIGHFDYDDEVFALYTDYEFFEAAKTSLTDNKVAFCEKEQEDAAKLFIKP